MKHKKKPIIPIVLLGVIFVGIGYAQLNKPRVGTAEELYEMAMEDQKKAEEAKKDDKSAKPLGDSRSGPTVSQLANSTAQAENMMARKIRKTEKSAVPVIWNTNPKPTKETPNDAATWNSWFRDGSGRTKTKS